MLPRQDLLTGQEKQQHNTSTLAHAVPMTDFGWSRLEIQTRQWLNVVSHLPNCLADEIHPETDENCSWPTASTTYSTSTGRYKWSGAKALLLLFLLVLPFTSILPFCQPARPLHNPHRARLIPRQGSCILVIQDGLPPPGACA